jgi:hypothetical protein
MDSLETLYESTTRDPHYNTADVLKHFKLEVPAPGATLPYGVLALPLGPVAAAARSLPSGGGLQACTPLQPRLLSWTGGIARPEFLSIPKICEGTHWGEPEPTVLFSVLLQTASLSEATAVDRKREVSATSSVCSHGGDADEEAFCFGCFVETQDVVPDKEADGGQAEPGKPIRVPSRNEIDFKSLFGLSPRPGEPSEPVSSSWQNHSNFDGMASPRPDEGSEMSFDSDSEDLWFMDEGDSMPDL